MECIEYFLNNLQLIYGLVGITIWATACVIRWESVKFCDDFLDIVVGALVSIILWPILAIDLLYEWFTGKSFFGSRRM